MKVLVTGGAGFIGSHVVDYLVNKKHEVSIIDNLSSGSKDYINKKAKFYKVDINSNKIREVFLREKPEFVVHCAAQISVLKSLENPLEDARTNILGTINLLENCVKFKVKKIVFLSSCAVYGIPKYLPVDEKHPTNPLSPYGISKMACEKYIEFYNKNYDLDYLILRLGNVYGPRQSNAYAGVISIFINNILAKKPIFINGDGKQTRDFIYVGDCANAILLGLNKKTNNKILNVSSGVETSVNQIYENIKKIIKEEIKVKHRGEIKGEIKRIFLSNNLAKKELGFKVQTGLEEGLLKTIEWFKNERKYY